MGNGTMKRQKGGYETRKGKTGFVNSGSGLMEI